MARLQTRARTSRAPRAAPARKERHPNPGRSGPRPLTRPTLRQTCRARTRPPSTKDGTGDATRPRAHPAIPRAGSPGALVVESHHRFRPSLMVGACVRGTFGGVSDGSGVADRYGLDSDDVPSALELRAGRVTSWPGFAISTSIPPSARNHRVATAR